MTISQAKLDANRRNAAKSTGPRTAAGKQVSSRNAVTHGLRAETLVLGEEDPQELEARREAWHVCLSPADEVEQRLVDDAVVHTWMQDRARRAQAVRASANLAQFGVAQAVTDAKEVEELGQRLYKDRLGPLTFYPTGSEFAKAFDKRTATTSYAGNNEDDPDRPSALVLRLQATLLGCEWMLGEWAELKAILDRRQKWLPSDKLKAVRLLGKQPLDAIDDRDVAMVYLATSVLHGISRWFWEISTELCEPDVRRFQTNADIRKLKSLKPKNAASAREALLSIIDRATERLTLKAEIHRERARLMAALAPDLMAFDESQAGERLRRYELASGRSLSRALEDLRKHRRSSSSVVSGPLSVVSGPLSVVSAPLSVVSAPLSVVSGPLSVVSGPLSVVSGETEVITQPIAPNEPTDQRENAPNEPTDQLEIAPNEPTDQLEIAPNEPTDQLETAPNEPTDQLETAPNEPTDLWEIAPNEPTDQRENVANEPTGQLENAPNEPTGPSVNVTNEPTGPNEIVTNEPTGPSVNVTNEPTGEGSKTEDGRPTKAHLVRENATNEHTNDHDNDGRSVGLVAGTNDWSLFAPLPTPREPDGQASTTEVETRKPMRAERLRKPNAQARKAAEEAMARGRARRREQRNKNGKPERRPMGRAARAGKLTSKPNEAREMAELNELMKALIPLRNEANPVPS